MLPDLAPASIDTIWLSLAELLRSQKAGGTPRNIIDQTRARIKEHYDAAVLAGAKLTKPNLDDDVYTGLSFVFKEADHTYDEEAAAEERECPLPADVMATPSLSVETLPRKQIFTPEECLAEIHELERLIVATKRRLDQLYRARASEKERYQSMTEMHWSRKRKIPPQKIFRARAGVPKMRQRRCLCGCRRWIKGITDQQLQNSSVAQLYLNHHFSTYLGYILAVERGTAPTGPYTKRERTMTREDLPAGLQARLRSKWTKCTMCGGFIPTVDPYGRPIEKDIGLYCWRREKGITWPYTRRAIREYQRVTTAAEKKAVADYRAKRAAVTYPLQPSTTVSS